MEQEGPAMGRSWAGPWSGTTYSQRSVEAAELPQGRSGVTGQSRTGTGL